MYFAIVVVSFSCCRWLFSWFVPDGQRLNTRSSLRSQERGLPWRAVADLEVRRLNPPLTFGKGLHSSRDESGRQQRPLDGMGRFAGHERAFGLGHQAGGISHVRGRRQIKQGGERGRFPFDSRGE